MIAGESSLLEEQGKKIVNALHAQDWATCFEQSRIAIEMIDESEKKAKGAGMSVATLNPTYLAQVYQIASDSARLTNHFVQSVEWAKDAIKNEDTGSRRAALVLSLRASNETVEAQKAVDEALTKDPKVAEEFRSTMAQAGSPL